MASTLEHTTPDRLRKVLLCRDDPPWPYPTEEEALALVAMLARVAPDPGMAATRVRTLQRRTGLTWSVVAPRQWEHFRAVSQYVLRWLSAKNPVGPIEESLRLVEIFDVRDHVNSQSFGKSPIIDADDKSRRCFKELADEARNLQRRYQLEGHNVTGKNFWFLDWTDHSRGKLSAGRLRLLSDNAQNILKEHVNYIANLTPLPEVHQLPNATQLLVNAELGARYLELKRAISNCRDMSEPGKEGYISRFNFPFIATLPLELTDELIKAVPDGLAQTPSDFLHAAVMRIYARHVEKILRLLADKEPRDKLKEWKVGYLRPLKSLNGDRWSPSGTAVEWAELQAAENQLLAGEHLSIKNLPKQAIAYPPPQKSRSLSHPYARVSHRMARRIGTTKEAWETERAARF